MISAVLSVSERTIRLMQSERDSRDKKSHHSCLHVEFPERHRCHNPLNATRLLEQGRL